VDVQWLKTGGKERKMEYLSSMERRAMERGRQAGILEGMQ
jgi:hypothetical protein